MNFGPTLWMRVLFGTLLGVALLYTIVPPWGDQADIWETSAAIQAISDSPVSPRNPLLDLPGDTSPRFTPYTFFWGIIDRLFGLPLFTTVALAGLANFLIFWSGMARVVRGVTGNMKAMLAVAPVMLLGWGSGYGEANGYQSELFFSTLAYVGTFTYGLCFHGLAELQRYLEGGSQRALAFYAALGILAFLTHPITALLLFVAGFAWTAARRGLLKAIFLSGVPLLAFASCFVWPFFDYPKLLLHGSTDSWYKVKLFSGQIRGLGPALFGFPVAAYFAWKRRYLEVALALALCSLVYLLSWALSIQIGSRFLFYGAIFAHLCIAFFVSDCLSGAEVSRPWLRYAAFMLLILVFLPGLYYRSVKLGNQWRPALEHFEESGEILKPWEDLAPLRSELSQECVVMVEDTVGWRIPAVTGARLVAQAKGNPLMQEEVNLRREDVTRFFQSPMDAHARAALLTKYHCSHVLVEKATTHKHDSSFDSSLDSLSLPVSSQASYTLYRVKPALQLPFKK